MLILIDLLCSYDIANHFCEMMGYNVDASRFPTKEFQLEWLRAYIAAQRSLERNNERTAPPVRHPP